MAFSPFLLLHKGIRELLITTLYNLGVGECRMALRCCLVRSVSGLWHSAQLKVCQGSGGVEEA